MFEKVLCGIIKQGEELPVITMKNDYIDKVSDYRLTMSFVKSMKIRGIISEKEYDKIDTIMTKKYGISSVSIFR